MKINSKIPQLVAHRGDSAAYPENTYLALQHALQAGAAGVEFDVHLSQDHVPIVIHDRLLERTSGSQGCVFDLTADQITQYNAGYPARFDDKYLSEKIPSLQKIVSLLLEWPDRVPFVELKRASLSHYGIQQVLDSVLHILQPLRGNFVLISYNQQALLAARERGVANIGWVFDQADEQAYQVAYQLRPEYLISDAEKVPNDLKQLWPGTWKWVLFEVNDPKRAIEWAAKGVHSIETNSLALYADHADFIDRRAN